MEINPIQEKLDYDFSDDPSIAGDIFILLGAFFIQSLFIMLVLSGGSKNFFRGGNEVVIIFLEKKNISE